VPSRTSSGRFPSGGGVTAPVNVRNPATRRTARVLFIDSLIAAKSRRTPWRRLRRKRVGAPVLAATFTVDGLLTGLHEPQATHLEMLAAFIAPEHLAHAYTEAIEHGYLWHEFGDVQLIV